MITLETINQAAQLAKELSEIIMFECMSQPAWHVFFEQFLEHYLLPVIGLGFLMSALYSMYQLGTKADKSKQDYFELLISVFASLIVVMAILIKLTALPFAFGPHLFLVGVGLGIVKDLVVFALQMKHVIESNAMDQAYMFKTTLSLMSKLAVFASVLAAFVTPIGPMFLFISSSTAALLIGIQMMNTLYEIYLSLKQRGNDKGEQPDTEAALSTSIHSTEGMQNGLFCKPVENEYHQEESDCTNSPVY